MNFENEHLKQIQDALNKAKEVYGENWKECIEIAWHNGSYGALKEDWTSTGLLQGARNHPSYGHKWLDSEHSKWIKEQADNKKILKDKRYTISKEFTGSSDGPQKVLRFCGEFVSAHPTVELAQKAQINHSKERMSDFQLPDAEVKPGDVISFSLHSSGYSVPKHNKRKVLSVAENGDCTVRFSGYGDFVVKKCEITGVIKQQKELSR